MTRFAAPSTFNVLALLIGFGAQPPRSLAAPSMPAIPHAVQSAGVGKKACDFIGKAEAESIVGASLVVHRVKDDECWYRESGFTNPTAPHNKQVYLNIWRTATPNPDDVNTTRVNITSREPTATITNVTDFADAALWTWTPGAGRF